MKAPTVEKGTCLGAAGEDPQGSQAGMPLKLTLPLKDLPFYGLFYGNQGPLKR